MSEAARQITNVLLRVAHDVGHGGMTAEYRIDAGGGSYAVTLRLSRLAPAPGESRFRAHEMTESLVKDKRQVEAFLGRLRDEFHVFELADLKSPYPFLHPTFHSFSFQDAQGRSHAFTYQIESSSHIDERYKNLVGAFDDFFERRRVTDEFFAREQNSKRDRDAGKAGLPQVSIASESLRVSNINAGKPKPSRTGAVIFALICAGLGLAFLYWSASQFWYVFTTRSWPQTQGTIYESRYIDHGRRRDGEVRLKYGYSVEGRTYQGGNLLPGNNVYTDADEQEKVRQYRPGMTVPVYYDPDNPESSALEVGVVTRFPFLALVLGLFFFSGAVYIGWNSLRNKPVRL